MGTHRQGGKIGSPDRIRPVLSGGKPVSKRTTPLALRKQEQQMWRGMGDAWNAVATLIAGIAVWGGIGYGIDRLAGTKPVLFVIGVLVGNFAGIYLLYVKYFKEEPRDAP